MTEFKYCFKVIQNEAENLFFRGHLPVFILNRRFKVYEKNLGDRTFLIILCCDDVAVEKSFSNRFSMKFEMIDLPKDLHEYIPIGGNIE